MRNAEGTSRIRASNASSPAETNSLDRTIHRSGSSAAFEIPILGVYRHIRIGTSSPARIRSGDAIERNAVVRAAP